MNYKCSLFFQSLKRVWVVSCLNAWYNFGLCREVHNFKYTLFNKCNLGFLLFLESILIIFSFQGMCAFNLYCWEYCQNFFHIYIYLFYFHSFLGIYCFYIYVEISCLSPSYSCTLFSNWMKASLNSVVLYNFRSFTHMLLYNPIITTFSSYPYSVPPPPFSPLVTTSFFSSSVSLFLFCYIL